MRLPDVAALWQSHGVSVVPILAKNKPAIRWREYQARCPTQVEIEDWWGNGHPYGIAIVCGNVSGGLEMTELEARALNSETLINIGNHADTLGVGDAWDMIIDGYTQGSPSGGLHLVYRIGDHDVPGNTKIVSDRTGPEPLVLAETRGEGGYFVGAPSPGSCHPSGEPWWLRSGTYGEVPVISWEQRCLIHQAITRALEPAAEVSTPGTDIATIPPAAPPPPTSPGLSRQGAASTSLSPADDWSDKTDWAEVLGDAGWTYHSASGGERFWVRPGKRWVDGHSASTDYNGKPGLYVWSTSAGLPTEEPLSKLFIYAHYSFSGNMSACAKYLKSKGYGNSTPAVALNVTDGEFTATVAKEQRSYSRDDSGNRMRLWDRVQDRFRFVHEEKLPYMFKEDRWLPEFTGALTEEFIQMTYEMEAEAIRNDDQATLKWARSSRMIGRINAAVNLVRTMPGATISATELNNAPNHLNLTNGEYNVETATLEPHQPEHFQTRITKAAYKPEATCPKWTQFLEDVLPDESVRTYVQRAVGYSMLGRSDERAFFLIYGPSGTGKSQFLSTLEYVFGSYATTAAEGTFRGGRDTNLTNDLHGLRGKRLVTTSETAENGNFNENLMKRLTGRDAVTSRDLYQSNITWTPECAIWIATNHPPRFNSDDNAIWRRAKLVPFLTEFGQGDTPEVTDYARKFLYAEADGILNWIIEGMHDYLEYGLGEPETVKQAAQQHREQSDTVMRFLDDMVADGTLQAMPEGVVRTRELYMLYEDWNRTSGERGLGSRRFMNRLESTGRATYKRTDTHSVWKGLHKPGSAPMLVGSFYDESDK